MLTSTELNRIVHEALNEDAPWGDITSQAAIPENQMGTAKLVAREAGVMACGEAVQATFANISADVEVDLNLANGVVFGSGNTLATVRGPLRSLLLGERVCLNLLQRACGIATLTRKYVEAASVGKAQIIDTRKTTPGLRAFEKTAVVCGGGRNHRFSLSDAVMIKDNHIAAWRARQVTIQGGLQEVKARVGHTTHIEVEVDDLATLADVLDADVADSVLLDNFTIPDIEVAVKTVDGRCVIEVSGGVSLDDVAAIAATGVDVISIGALTHGARAIDIGMDIESA